MSTRLAVFTAFVLTALSGAFAQPSPEPAARTVWANAQDGAMVSPDGRLIAFVDWNFSEVAVRDVASGTERRLPDSTSLGFPEPYFVFSPKSDSLVFPFGSNRAGDPFGYELRSIDLATGAHHVLAMFPTDVALVVPLAWHASAGILFNRLAADGSSELVLLDPATKNVRVLQRRGTDAGQVWQAEFTGDGRGVVVLARDSLSWIDVGDGAMRPLGLGAQVLLGWGADERSLLFHADRSGVTGNWSVGFSQGKPVGEPALMHRTAPGVRWAGRSENGVHYLEPAQTPALFVANIDLAAARIVSPPEPVLPMPGFIPGHPVWSRDGSRLAFALAISNRNENRIFVAEGLGGAAREVAQTNLRVTGLDWSADGKFIIVGGRALTRDQSWVGRINASTGAIEKLVTGAPTNAVAAGAGDEVVFSRAALAGSRNVHVMHVHGAGKMPRVLATYTINDLPRSMSASPDGNWVAILKSVPEAKASALILIPINGGEPRTVLQLQRPDGFELNQGSVPWMSDGRVLVLVRRQGKRQLAAIRVDSGEIRTLPFAPEQAGRSFFTLHRDRRQLVYVDGPGRDELKVIKKR